MKKRIRMLAAALALCLALTGTVMPVLAEDVTAAAQAILDQKEYASTYKSYFSTSYPSLN